MENESEKRLGVYMDLQIRKLTNEGIRRFHNEIEREGDPTYILEDKELHTPVEGLILERIQDIDFSSSLNLGRTLNKSLAFTGRVRQLILRNLEGISGWLSLYFLKEISADPDDESKKFASSYRYILSPNQQYKSIYRHLILGPWKIYSMHREDSRVYLTGEVRVLRDEMYVFADNFDMIESKSVCTFLNSIFWDGEKNRVVRDRRSAIRNLHKYLKMVRVDWNLLSIDQDRLLQNTPSEILQLFS